MKHIGRKLYHILGGLGPPVALLPPRAGNRPSVVYAVSFCVVLAADLMRLKIPAVNRFVYDRFGSFIRKNEEKKLTGTAPYILGIASSLYLYRTDIATAAVCFLACGDVAATTIGERYGRTKIGQKSLEGALAFVVCRSGSRSAASFCRRSDHARTRACRRRHCRRRRAPAAANQRQPRHSARIRRRHDAYRPGDRLRLTGAVPAGRQGSRH